MGPPPRRRLGRKGIEAGRAPAGGIIEPCTSGLAGAVSGGRRTYHAIVAARVRKLFKRLGLWDYPLVLLTLAAQRDHGFVSFQRLAGARRTHAAIKRWYDRLPRISPVKEVLGRNAAWGIAEAVAPPYSIDRKAG